MDTFLRWAVTRAWTAMADQDIAPLDHHLRELLQATSPEEWAGAPPRVRAALTDLLQAIVAMLLRLPDGDTGTPAELAAQEYVNTVFPNSSAYFADPPPVRAEDAWRMVHEAFVHGFTWGT